MATNDDDLRVAAELLIRTTQLADREQATVLVAEVQELCAASCIDYRGTSLSTVFAGLARYMTHVLEAMPEGDYATLYGSDPERHRQSLADAAAGLIRAFDEDQQGKN